MAAHHLQFYYPFEVLRKQDLLEKLQEQVAKFRPIHIAIGTHFGATHCYLEVEVPIRRQMFGKHFLLFEQTKPIYEKYINNFLKFSLKFSKFPPDHVLHYRPQKQNDSDQVLKELQSQNQNLKSRNIYLCRKIKAQAEQLNNVQSRLDVEIKRNLEQSELLSAIQKIERRKKSQYKQSQNTSPVIIEIVRAPGNKYRLSSHSANSESEQKIISAEKPSLIRNTKASRAKRKSKKTNNHEY